MKGRNTTVIQIRVRDEVADTFKALAKVEGCTVSDIVRPILLNYRNKMFEDGLIDKNGKVVVRGEVWSANTDDDILKNDKIEVIDTSGMVLQVKKTDTDDNENTT